MYVDWTKIIETGLGPLLGTLIGGGIAIGGIAIKEYFDRRRAVQEWFEQYYIISSLDSLLTYVATIVAYIKAKRDVAGSEIPARLAENLPIESIPRFLFLLRDSQSELAKDIGDIIYGANGIYNPRREIHIGEFNKYLRVFVALTTMRLTLVTIKIKNKGDLETVWKNPAMKKLIADYVKIKKSNP